MKNRIVMSVLAGSSLFAAGAAYAQGLNPALDDWRAQSPQVQLAAAQPLTLAERQAAWSNNKTEYRRRLARDGKASADRWLDEQALPTKTKPQSKAATRTSKKNCKKVRWVNRATPGFGGAPMTMRRVAVCAD